MKGGATEGIWLSSDRSTVSLLQSAGYDARHPFSFSGLCALFSAGVIVTDSKIPDALFWFTGNMLRINLWHGVGIKKIERDIKRGRLTFLYQATGLKKWFYYLLMPSSLFNAYLDCVISTSPTFQNIFARAFGLKRTDVPITGYPRNDCLLVSIDHSDIGIDQALKNRVVEHRGRGGSVVLYAPTFRDTQEDLFAANLTASLSALNTFAEQRNMLFVFKPHEHLAHIFDGVTLGSYASICIADARADIYPILPFVDVLVTDYSSISTDFLYLDRPIVFFPYDIHKYLQQDREFYFEYKEFMPGPQAYTLDELLVCLDTARAEDTYSAKREEVRQKCFTHYDGHSSERVVAHLQKLTCLDAR